VWSWLISTNKCPWNESGFMPNSWSLLPQFS
jgi:hypothetical protein